MTAREDWLEDGDKGGRCTWLEWCELIDLRDELDDLDAQASESIARRVEILKVLQRASPRSSQPGP